MNGSYRTSLGLALFCGMLFSGAAPAALVATDWKVAGDGLLTYDGEAGLEWLDLTVTAGASFSDIGSQLGPGETYEGFRYASFGDLQTLFEHAGVQITNGDAFDAPGLAAAQTFLSLFGVIKTVTTVSQTHYQSLAMYDGPEVKGGDTPTAYVEWYNAFNPAYNANLSSGTWFENVPSVDVGTFLVRDAPVVPLPPSAWLLATALVALGPRLRRMRARGNRAAKDGRVTLPTISRA